MKRKIKWRTLKFIPIGGDDSQVITIKSKGFMKLWDRYRDGCSVPGYSTWDMKGMCDRYGWNNLTSRWQTTCWIGSRAAARTTCASFS